MEKGSVARAAGGRQEGDLGGGGWVSPYAQMLTVALNPSWVNNPCCSGLLCISSLMLRLPWLLAVRFRRPWRMGMTSEALCTGRWWTSECPALALDAPCLWCSAAWDGPLSVVRTAEECHFVSGPSALPQTSVGNMACLPPSLRAALLDPAASCPWLPSQIPTWPLWYYTCAL